MFVMLILTASMSPTLSPAGQIVCQLGGSRSPPEMTRKYQTEHNWSSFSIVAKNSYKTLELLI